MTDVRNNVAVGFAPWIVFWVISAPSTWKWASLAALIVALGIALPGFVPDRAGRRAGISALDGASLAFFAVVSVLALVLQRNTLAVLELYAQTLSMALLAVVAIVGAVVGRPFTAFYARQGVPEQYWGTPEFLRVNRVISLVWGAAFVVIAVAGFVAVRYAVALDLLQWVVPVVALVAAARFTQAYTADDRTDRTGPTPERAA
ncbi:hypothetical protein GCM10023201_27070 [Actinomycetospora corticicola]